MAQRVAFSLPLPTNPCTDFVDEVREALPGDYQGPEHRGHQRRPLCAALRAVEVDDKYQPRGEEFTLLVRDISSGGISFVDSKPLDANLIAVELRLDSADPLHMVVQIVRCRSIDRYYDIGGKFVARLE